MRVHVDTGLCENHGQCAIAAPDVFRMNDEYELEYVFKPDDSQLEFAEEAADVCPVQAIIAELS
jgi:ferredoxin